MKQLSDPTPARMTSGWQSGFSIVSGLIYIDSEINSARKQRG
ncbi:MAG: hypothetical protein V3U54_02910 [Thermodesulfobacteriota bacterium]